MANELNKAIQPRSRARNSLACQRSRSIMQNEHHDLGDRYNNTARKHDNRQIRRAQPPQFEHPAHMVYCVLHSVRTA